MSKAHGMMQLPGEKKNYLEIIKGELNTVKNMDDLKSIGEIVKIATKLDKRDIEELLSLKFNQSKMLPQIVALCIVVPVNVAPKPLNTLIKKIIPDFNSLTKNIQNGLTYKYVETGLLSGEGRQLFEEGVVASLSTDSPAYFAGPYLYLLASIKNPIDIFEKHSITYSKSARIDTMTLYHYGEVLLLLNNYDKSEKYLLRAYKLAKRAKISSLIEPIVDYLSLASFLNHVPYDVFCKYIKYTQQPKNFALSIWDIDHPGYLNNIDDKYEYFTYFKGEILREHTRRVIFDYAETTSEMTLQSLCEACNNDNIEEVLSSLRSSGELKFKIHDGNIKFIRLNYQDQIDCEQAKIDDLLKLVKPSKTS